MKLQLESALGILSLNGIAETGRGFQAQPGLTGMGLPPILTMWSEGAGNGGTYRGTRVRPRDFDIPLHILGRDREHLKELISEFALTITGGCRMRWIEQEGTEWWMDIHLVGGGSFIYGRDTIGSRELNTVITVRAGDPFWTSALSDSLEVTASSDADPFIPSFMTLPLAASDTLGELTFNNTGDAPAYPLWHIRGPGDFEAVSSTGQSFSYVPLLDVDETLVIDSKNATARLYVDAGDPAGTNAYPDLGAAPKFWQLPPGISTATVSMTGTDANSKVTVSWSPRKWVVI